LKRGLKLFNNINKDERNIIHWEMCAGALLQYISIQPWETIGSKIGRKGLSSKYSAGSN
jgi:hypothetical protein